ncbi:hypothetical protein RIF29_33710 [Crotalaria pallida]|uniref:Uncharacterized protein n=1 Tax=Crotalaria pallida TaxID=3830 RepID=A0AAN9HQV3_CROPI
MCNMSVSLTGPDGRVLGGGVSGALTAAAQVQGWWKDLLHGKIYKELDQSGKMVLLIEILTMSSDVGDKVLVFSQNIPTLDLIERFLSTMPRLGKRGKF